MTKPPHLCNVYIFGRGDACEYEPWPYWNKELELCTPFGFKTIQSIKLSDVIPIVCVAVVPPLVVVYARGKHVSLPRGLFERLSEIASAVAYLGIQYPPVAHVWKCPFYVGNTDRGLVPVTIAVGVFGEKPPRLNDDITRTCAIGSCGSLNQWADLVVRVGVVPYGGYDGGALARKQKNMDGIYAHAGDTTHVAKNDWIYMWVASGDYTRGLYADEIWTELGLMLISPTLIYSSVLARDPKPNLESR
jgi:hypothetical protein